MNNNVLAINAAIGQQAAEGVTGLEAKVRTSMAAVLKEGLFSRDSGELFTAALCGALQCMGIDSDDGHKLSEAVKYFRTFEAYFAAMMAGLKVEPPPTRDDLPPLMKWWKEEHDKAGQSLKVGKG